MEEKTFEFVFPSTIMWDKETYRDNYGKMILEPLERGFGVTVGNALRRVLLSSVPGVAITGLKISNIQHEFTTIPGVKEDTTQIVLNLKQVICRPRISSFPYRSSVTIAGISEICARDLVKDSSIEILNPDLHIATIDPSTKITVDIEITSGKGYLPVEKMKLIRKDIPADMILIDGLYSPVKKVSFHVENTRVGPLVDYEKLILEVWTNGAVSPHKALMTATEILNKHFIKIQSVQTIEDESSRDMAQVDNLNMSITDLNLSTRIIHILQENNIKTLKDLLDTSLVDLEKMKNLGDKSIEEIEGLLKKMGYRLKQE